MSLRFMLTGGAASCLAAPLSLLPFALATAVCALLRESPIRLEVVAMDTITPCELLPRICPRVEEDTATSSSFGWPALPLVPGLFNVTGASPAAVVAAGVTKDTVMVTFPTVCVSDVAELVFMLPNNNPTTDDSASCRIRSSSCAAATAACAASSAALNTRVEVLVPVVVDMDRLVLLVELVVCEMDE